MRWGKAKHTNNGDWQYCRIILICVSLCFSRALHAHPIDQVNIQFTDYGNLIWKSIDIKQTLSPICDGSMLFLRASSRDFIGRV